MNGVRRDVDPDLESHDTSIFLVLKRPNRFNEEAGLNKRVILFVNQNNFANQKTSVTRENKTFLRLRTACLIYVITTDQCTNTS